MVLGRCSNPQVNFQGQSPGFGRIERGYGVIRLANVAHDYGGRALLTGIDLHIAPGAFHFLTGPSGAGKSTLLKLCYGELRPVQGEIELFGQSLRGMSRDALADMRRRIGVIHQDCQFLDHLTLAENVALPFVATGRPVPQTDLRELLAWVGLAGQAESLPPTLSGGERQRAALARAVIMSPEVVLADEPTGNVDAEMSQRLLSLLVELNRMGTAVMIATHDLALIRNAKAQVSARVLRIQDRTLQSAGADL